MATETVAIPTSFADFEADPAAARTAIRVSRTETKPAAAEPAEIAEEEPAPSGTQTQEPTPAPTVTATPREKRIQELIAERKADKERFASLEARLEAFEKGQKPAVKAGPVEPAKPTEDQKPIRPRLSKFEGTLDEFDVANDKYEDDMEAWRERQGKKQQQASQQQTAKEKISADYRTKVDEYVKTHPKFDSEIAKMQFSPTTVDAILRVGPELGQALIDNPAEARRISGLSPEEQIFALGQLSRAGTPVAASPADPDELELEDDPQPAKIPARLGANGGGAPLKPQNAKTFAQFEAAKERLKTRR